MLFPSIGPDAASRAYKLQDRYGKRLQKIVSLRKTAQTQKDVVTISAAGKLLQSEAAENLKSGPEPISYKNLRTSGNPFIKG